MLIYGLTVSSIGLPVGLILNLPYVWVLSIIGIIVSLIKMKKQGSMK
jgi:type III secretory pathway component EscS